MIEYVDWRGFKVHPDNVPMARPGVYEFRCIVNGKPYIGITGAKTGIAGRCWNSARRHGGQKFTNAIRKYGTDAFALIPLFYTIGEVDRKWLSQFEADLIAENDSVKNGYNIIEASGSVGPYGEEFSAILREVNTKPEVKARQSAAAYKRNARPEVKAKISAALRITLARPEVKVRRSAIAMRPEVKAKQSKSLGVTNAKPEVRARRSAAQRISQARPEVKAKASATNARPEVKERRSLAAQEINARPGMKAKKSEAARIANARPEVKAKQSESARLASARPGVKARQSEAHRASYVADPTIGQRGWATRRANVIKLATTC